MAIEAHVKVATIDGKEYTHIYEVAELAELKKQMDRFRKTIKVGMGFVGLSHPRVLYNVQHVVALWGEAVGPDSDQKQEAETALGFKI